MSKHLPLINDGIRFLKRKIFKPGLESAEYEGFIKIYNNLSNSTFQMYLRKDSYMEKEFKKNGLYGGWEKESLKIWAELCKRCIYIIDVGANTGVYSLLAENQNIDAKVFAVEPIMINYNILKKNININRYNINADKIALSSDYGTGKMYMLKNKLNYMTSVNDNRYLDPPQMPGTRIVKIKVPLKPFEYLKRKYDIPKIDLIKIDVEGHEVNVLKGMYDLIEANKPVILLEVIGDKNTTDLNDMFKTLQYKFVSINEVNKSTVVPDLWDNDHHNFLLCNDEIINYLRSKELVN